MPHRKKKPFIEKKAAVTFHLVHRSQRDPLAADETAPQRVLLPTEKVEREKRKEEQRKFGVFFDDDYNYLQHLKETGPAELVPSETQRTQRRIIVTEDGKVEEEDPSINLPSSVFASEFEEDIGLLNKAAPQEPIGDHGLHFYEQFDDDEIGALDNAELEGFIHADSNRLQDVVENYFKERAKECVKLKDVEHRPELDLIEEDEEDKEEMQTLVLEEPGEKWDCESILSMTREILIGSTSAIYNRAAVFIQPLVKLIKVSTKSGIPLGVLPERGLTAKQIERMEMINGGDLPKVSTQPRSKCENTDERKARKQAIKEERKKRSTSVRFDPDSRQKKKPLNVGCHLIRHTTLAVSCPVPHWQFCQMATVVG
ncbi:hypothetical protein GDO78_001466 [Eleutherodactylus coqui]|uniref:Protein LTV1 homolog n=1 Tax=Eleutherodactylus coqui TaxID=57060 RepID=A0A8J6FTT0_ELECQ|nr:hypothetical protein GDO78_001466 [Eleutherodactylus coqui]